MDTSAFEEDDGLDVNVVELYQTLPEDVQQMIGTILCLSLLLAKVGLLVIAAACCAFAFCLLIFWICLYWLLTCLVLGLSMVLRFCYKHENNSGGDAARGSSSDGLVKSEESKSSDDEHVHHANKHHDATPDPHTSADLDLFEAFLNSPRDPIQRDNRVQEVLHQCHQCSPKATEHEEAEQYPIGAEDALGQSSMRGENNSLEVRDALTDAKSPCNRRKTDCDEDTQLSFEPSLTGTVEQLKEAASLQAAFSKAGSPRHRSNKHVSRTRAFQQDIRAINTAKTKDSNRSRSYIGFASTKNSTIPMLRQSVDSSETQASKTSTPLKSTTLPPHLRNKTNAPRHEDSGKKIDEENSTSQGVDEPSLNNQQVDANFSNHSSNAQEDSRAGMILNEDGNGRGNNQTKGSHVPARQTPSFDEPLKMDQQERSPRHANVVEEGCKQDPVRYIASDPAPHIQKPAQRSMSIEYMKSLNIASAHAEDGVVLENLDPNTLKKIERLAKISRIQARDDAFPPTIPRKMEKMQTRIQNIAMLESELNQPQVELARRLGKEEATRLEQAALERGRIADKQHEPSSTEFSQRDHALRQVVGVINKEVHGQVEITQRQSKDKSTAPHNIIGADETANLASTQDQHSAKSLEASTASSPLLKAASRTKPPNSLSPQATAFQPQSKPKASDATTMKEQSTLRPSSDVFVPSANGTVSKQKPTNTGAFSLSDNFITTYARDPAFCYPYSNSTSENAHYVGNFADQYVLPALHSRSNIGSGIVGQTHIHQSMPANEAAVSSFSSRPSDGSSMFNVTEAPKNLELLAAMMTSPPKAAISPSKSFDHNPAPSLGSFVDSSEVSGSVPSDLPKADIASQQQPASSLNDLDSHKGSPSFISNASQHHSESEPNIGELYLELKASIAQDLAKVSADEQVAARYVGLLATACDTHPDIYNKVLRAASRLGTKGDNFSAVDTLRTLFVQYPDLIGVFNALESEFGSPNLVDSGNKCMQSFHTEQSEDQTLASIRRDDDSGRKRGSEDQADSTSDKQSSANVLKKKRQKARHALQEASSEREVIRKRVASTWTLEGARGLQEATEKYMQMRSELASCMATGELREEDVVAFPVLGKKDLAAPKKGQFTAAPTSKMVENGKINSAENKQPSANRVDQAEEESNPPLTSRAKLDSLLEEAIEAREKYVDALDYMTRSPPEHKIARGNIGDVRKTFEARIQAASKRYHRKVEAVKAEFPDGKLPPDIDEMLEEFNDKDEKELRDHHLRKFSTSPSNLPKRKWSSRRGRA